MKKIIFLIFLFTSLLSCKASCSDKSEAQETFISVDELVKELEQGTGEKLNQKNCRLKPIFLYKKVVESDVLYSKYLQYNTDYILGNGTTLVSPEKKEAFKHKQIEQTIAELFVALAMQDHSCKLED